MKTDTGPARIPLYVLAYVLWLVSIAICIAAVVQLQSTVTVLWAAFGGDRYSMRLANQVAVLLGGFVAFIYVMFLESYYREGARRRALLLRRFAITMAVPLAVFVVSLGLLEIALRRMQ